MNKKILFTILLGTLVLSVLPLNHISASAELFRPETSISLATLIVGIRKAVWEIFAGLAVIMFVVAGILFITANGEPEKLKTARAAVIWGAIGIIVAIVGYSIETMIQGALR